MHFFYYFIYLFIVKFISINSILFFFRSMAIVLMIFFLLVVAMDDLNFGVRDVTFEANVFNKYDTFDRIVK